MKKIITYIVIMGLFLAAALCSSAIESKYRNNLLNVELNQTPDNRVSVLLVFEKPYTDPVKVVYKADNEYNILLPETYHSVTSVSTAKTLNIRSASVKLVPYFNTEEANGYTKIVIKTTRPVIFNAHASFVTTKIAKDDLLEKLEKEETPKTASSASSTKKAQTTPKAAPAKTAAKTPAKPTQKTTIAKKPVAAKAKKPAAKQPVAVKKASTATVPVKTAQKPAVTPKTDVQPSKPTEAPKTEPIATTAPVSTPAPVIDTQPAVKEKTLLEKLNNQSQNDNMTIIVLIASSIALLILLLRFFNKTAQNYIKPRKQTVPVVDTTEETDIPDEIKSMTWQEKFKYMKNKEEAIQAAQQAAQQAEISNQLDSIYENSPNLAPRTNEIQPETVYAPDEEPSYTAQPVEYAASYTSDPFKQSDSTADEDLASLANLTGSIDELSELNNLSYSETDTDEIYTENIDNIEPESDINISEPASFDSSEPTLINQAKISKTKGFYLIRYENEVALVGYIKDKIFFIHSFSDIDQSFVQTRLTEKNRSGDIYLVRSNDYKALVQVSKSEMKTLINL